MAGQGTKPWLLLAGDDDGKAYYFVPFSEDPNNWDYDTITFLDETGDSGTWQIIGQMATADADGDGLTEIYIPSYYKNRVLIYEFSPVE